jgi:LuxR family maltose regulon positive regulatory protein
MLGQVGTTVRVDKASTAARPAATPSPTARFTAPAAWTGAASPAVSQLARKLTPPPLGQAPILRHRLLALLSSGITRTPLTLLSGKTGSGKSMLAASWRRTRADRSAVAWLTLHDDDDDPATFWRHTLEALAWADVQGTGVRRPSTVDPSMRNAGRFTSRAPGLVTPTVLILDNADSLSRPEVLAGLDELIRVAGRQLRVVLCARADPQLPLARYRRHGIMTEIREAQLRFTGRETRELLGNLGAVVSPAAAHALCRQTDGWAVALRLAAASLKQGEDPDRLVSALAADDSGAVSHLVEKVLAEQPADVRRFLLRISVTNELWPALANRLEGHPSQPMLAGLARASAFVERAPGAPGGYRIPSLLREELFAQLSYELPSELPALHRICADFYAQVGRHAEAAQHAVAADGQRPSRSPCAREPAQEQWPGNADGKATTR